jgi:hypothetical protein
MVHWRTSISPQNLPHLIRIYVEQICDLALADQEIVVKNVFRRVPLKVILNTEFPGKNVCVLLTE